MSLDSSIVASLPAVEADLNYTVPMAERARDYAYDPPPGVPHSNTTLEARRFAIRDIRPVATRPSLDGEGFAALRHQSAVSDFYDDEEVVRVYYPEAAALNEAKQPAREVHVDQTVKSGPQRVRDLLPAEAGKLLAGRVQIINLWRPIRGPVRDAPLAVCDARSVAPADLMPSDLIYRDRIGETYSVTWNPVHRWFYLSGMTPDEALLVKCYESRTDGRARFAPHSAFTDPTAPADAPLRESIELRTLVFHDA